jgi:phospholipid/cholesterol/gamma-HCH transport system substrate-binding protein
METTAKYRLMGAFTLVAALGVFGFVYWLNHGGGLGERSVYQIRFLGPVPGLRPGAAVQFNGIRVGEITDLRLDANQPQLVVATISIDRETPIRTDTHVSLDFQGLMGVTSVALKGGSADATALKSAGSPPLLVADISAGSDLTATAREALRRLDSILADNSETLRGTLTNLQTFTGALAKNSTRIDNIVAGLERMTGGDGSKAQTLSFDLTAPRSFPRANSEAPRGLLAVAEPTAPIIFDTQKLLMRASSGARTQIAENAQWTDTLPKLVQIRIIQAYENATSPASVGRSADNIAADRQLLIDIRNFEILASEHPVGIVELSAKLVGDKSQIVDARTFSATAPAASTEAVAAAASLDHAFAQVAADLVIWARNAH